MRLKKKTYCSSCRLKHRYLSDAHRLYGHLKCLKIRFTFCRHTATMKRIFLTIDIDFSAKNTYLCNTSTPRALWEHRKRKDEQKICSPLTGRRSVAVSTQTADRQAPEKPSTQQRRIRKRHAATMRHRQKQQRYETGRSIVDPQGPDQEN